MNMDELYIPHTKNTPGVAFVPGANKYSISGRSIPENASDFYAPVLSWLQENLPRITEPVVFSFDLPYFNSSSMKALYLVLTEIRNGQQAGRPVHVHWFVEDDDEFMVDAAETFQELTKIDLEIKPGSLGEAAV